MVVETGVAVLVVVSEIHLRSVHVSVLAVVAAVVASALIVC